MIWLGTIYAGSLSRKKFSMDTTFVVATVVILFDGVLCDGPWKATSGKSPTIVSSLDVLLRLKIARKEVVGLCCRV